MSSKSDRIDLNSDAVLVDGDNVTVTETLTDHHHHHPLNGQGLESVDVTVNVNGDSLMDIELELGIGKDKEDISMGNETKEVQVKPNSSSDFGDTIESKSGGVVDIDDVNEVEVKPNSSSDFGDTIESKNGDGLVSIGVEPCSLVVNIDEPVLDKNPDAMEINVPLAGASQNVGNESSAMEINADGSVSMHGVVEPHSLVVDIEDANEVEVKLNSSSVFGDTTELKNADGSVLMHGGVDIDESVSDKKPDAMEINVLLTGASQNDANESNGAVEFNADGSVSMHGGVEPHSLVVDIDESVPDKNPNAMEINVPLAGASQNDADELQLVVDLNSYVSTDGNKSNDVNVKSAVSKREFRVNDLVWGKVRSHPWWPGQIFDPAAASEKAKKYFKKDSYLIAYFGDQTFAWNEAPRIKPFRSHFSRMEKQSSLEDFHYAVDCALEEVSRRVELGLACYCISEDVYAKIKTQITVNAGIREESSRRDGGDSFSSAASFEPVKPVGFIKDLARQPHGGVDRLEFVTTQAQLLAFYRWKGYSQLPELNMLGELLESDADVPLSAKVKHGDEVTENAAPDLKNDEQVPSQKGKSKSEDGPSLKQKHILADSMHPCKKEKSLSEFMAEARLSMSNSKKGSDSKAGGEGSDSKAGGKLMSSSSGKKRKAVDTISDDSVGKHSKGHQLSLGAADKSSPSKQTYRVGNSILKVASQLNGWSPVLKNSSETSHKTAVKSKSKEKSLSGKSESEKHLPSENSSPDEILSQLCLAARDPMKKYNFLISIVDFFSEFRNSVSLDPSNSRDHEPSSEQVYGGDTGEKSTNLENTEASELDRMKDSYWTDMILEDMPVEQLSPMNQNEAGEFLPENQNEAEEFMPETPSEKVLLTAETQSAVQLSPTMDSEWQTVGGNLELEAGKPVGHLDESCNEDLSPTALILNFTDLDSVPSETNLNMIFSRYGPLNESETEVLKKSSRARVVFKRRADAETAFSSAGKYSTFGPSLVSYRLKYMPSTPNPKRSRKDATLVEGNAI